MQDQDKNKDKNKEKNKDKNKENNKSYNIFDEIERRHKLFNEKKNVTDKCSPIDEKPKIGSTNSPSVNESIEAPESIEFTESMESSESIEQVKNNDNNEQTTQNMDTTGPIITHITLQTEENTESEQIKVQNDNISQQITEPVPPFTDSGAEISIIKKQGPIDGNKSKSADANHKPERTEVISEEQNKPYITDFDLHLFQNGTYYKIFEKFGAHIISQNDVTGVQFTTWAPNAAGISVIGEFNGWQEGSNGMHRINENGVWTVFIPGLKEGDTYKYAIRTFSNESLRKSDPYAFRSEMRPKNASVVAEINNYTWNDEGWVNRRNSGNSSYKSIPVNIFELHLGSWKRDYENRDYPNEWGYLSYSQLAHDIVAYVKKMGYTHIELMPVMEHPLDISWGYQVTCYYAPTSRFGTPADFMYFVDYCHQNDIGVILDWVPAHFPSDDFSLGFFDGKQIYGYENIKKGMHKDWGTYVFDYGKPEVQNFLIGSALFWLEKYHADGLRVDAVASMLYLDYSREQGEWEPNVLGGRENLEAIEFLKHLNDIVHTYHRNVMMIAEESTAWPAVSHPVSQGGLGFDMKWNMGWMNDILLYFSKDPVHRKFHQGKITFSLWYAFTENFVLPVSHDEVVHGKKSLLDKMPGDNWQKFANLRLFFGFMFGHPGKKLNFMGGDIAQYNEWNCETQIDWALTDIEMNKKLNLYMKDINELYKNNPALYELDFEGHGFQWIDFSDALNSILSFYRISNDGNEIILFTFNMTPTVRENYTFGVPMPGFYKEILNSDAEIYGGSGIGNMGGKSSEPVSHKDWKNSIKVVLPPLAVNVYKWEKPKPNEDMVDVIENTVTDIEELYVDTDTEGGG